MKQFIWIKWRIIVQQHHVKAYYVSTITPTVLKMSNYYISDNRVFSSLLFLEAWWQFPEAYAPFLFDCSLESLEIFIVIASTDSDF